MKKGLQTTSLVALALFTIPCVGNAQSTLIHYWNFNSFATSITLPSVADLNADYTAISTPTAALVYQPIPGTSSSFSDYCDYYATVVGDYDTANLRLGDTAGNSFRARNPSDSMEILLFMPTTGYKNLVIKYDCELSSYTSGDSVNVFSYSVDSGTTWKTSGTGLSEWVDSGSLAFRMVTVTVNDTLANNNRKFVFRIETMGRNSLTSGNNRFDNITLDGMPTSPLSIANQNVATDVYHLFPNPVSGQLTIGADVAGSRSYTITNSVGQVLGTGTANNAVSTADVSNLSAGIYFISIRDEASGSLKTLEFVKQ